MEVATMGTAEAQKRRTLSESMLIGALGSVLNILRYYHDRGDCENPDNCGHCRAARKADRALWHAGFRMIPGGPMVVERI